LNWLIVTPPVPNFGLKICTRDVDAFYLFEMSQDDNLILLLPSILNSVERRSHLQMGRRFLLEEEQN